MQVDQLTALVAAIGGLTGLWGLLTVRSKQAHERQLKAEQKSAAFNENLKDQVDSLNGKVDRLLNEKESLLNQMAEIKAELAEARATIRHLEDILRVRATDAPRDINYPGRDR